jgi:hypothetical protein
MRHHHPTHCLLCGKLLGRRRVLDKVCNLCYSGGRRGLGRPESEFEDDPPEVIEAKFQAAKAALRHRRLTDEEAFQVRGVWYE